MPRSSVRSTAAPSSSITIAPLASAPVAPAIGATGAVPGDAARAVTLITGSLELWRGMPFGDLTADDRAPEVARLDEVRWELRELLATAYRELGRHADAIGLLRAMT